MKKYYFVYLTTNLINGKKYIGRHSTDNLNDGYLGSGVIIKKLIQKYGKENFKREILENCNDLEDNIIKEMKWINLNKAETSNDFYNLPLKYNNPKIKKESFIRVYLDETDLFSKLNGGSNFKILFSIFSLIEFNQMEMIMDKKIKTIISELVGVKLQSVSDCISKLVKNNFLSKAEFRGYYRLNPNYFFKGEEKIRKSLIEKYNELKK